MAGIFFLSAECMAQVSGTVTDAVTKEKIYGAAVELDNAFQVTTTDSSGKFSFVQTPSKGQLKVTHVGYEPVVVEFTAANQLVVSLAPRTYVSGEAIVTATRASDKSPTAFSSVGKAALEKNNLGQDVPFLLNTLPSFVSTSDAGAGVGYSYMRLRGSDAERINVTINGVPVNDAEGNGMYWVDLPDIISSADNIQVQRGLGTSTNGAGAFGGSINILTSKLSPSPFATLSESYGSFNTWKHTLNFGTGLLKNKIAFEGRLSKISSDGFIDRSTSDLKSFYLTGGYYGVKHTLRAILFSGKEKTYQAWNGVPEAKLRNDQDALVNHYYNNLGYLYFTPEDSLNLFTSDSRTYNVFTYKNQTDNYQQDYYQLHYSLAATQRWMLNATLHYTKGKGYYEEFKNDAPFAEYSMEDVVSGTDTLTTTNLIRQKWLDNDFYGITLSSVYSGENLELTVGGAAYRYEGAHFDKVIWAQYAGHTPTDFIYDDNDADKKDYNVFAKAIYSLNKKIHLYGDIQYRMIGYSFWGFNALVEAGQQQVSYGFFNPKVGITYTPGRLNKLYVSAGLGHHEPVRKDFIESSASSRPKPEEMIDAEGGYIFSSNRLRVGTNIYFMNYKDQLVSTGKVNDVGEYTRINVPVSVRAGAELEAEWKILRTLSVSANLTVSRNKIKSFTEYVDDYDAGMQRAIAHEQTDIAFSPNTISAGVVSWIPIKNFSIDFTTKYVGQQFLDNTSDDTRMLDAYLLNDVLFQYHFSLPDVKDIALKFAVYNLFNQEYESNGYTYGYYYGGNLVQENFYYPQAGINFLGGVQIKF